MESLGQMQNSIKIITICCIVGILSGCSLFRVYRFDQQQGNLITNNMVQELQVGMTRDQVTYILGTPVLDNPFDSNEWDYVYRLNAADGKVYIKRLSITFQNNRVSNILKSGDFEKTPVAKKMGGPATAISSHQGNTGQLSGN